MDQPVSKVELEQLVILVVRVLLEQLEQLAKAVSKVELE
jgi:hypothetical protein